MQAIPRPSRPRIDIISQNRSRSALKRTQDYSTGPSVTFTDGFSLDANSCACKGNSGRGFRAIDCSRVSDQKKVEDNPNIDCILSSLDNTVTLQEFIAAVAPCTSDKGESMRAVMAEELSSFRDLLEKVFNSRMNAISHTLAKEQICVRNQLGTIAVNFRMKAQKCQQLISEMIPHFEYPAYNDNPTYVVDRITKMWRGQRGEGEEGDYLQKWNLLEALKKDFRRLQSENTDLETSIEVIRSKRRSIELRAAQDENQKRAEYVQLMKSLMAKQAQYRRVALDRFAPSSGILRKCYCPPNITNCCCGARHQSQQ